MAEGDVVTHEEWVARGRELFGDPPNWKFVCPVCKDVSGLQDLLDAGHDQDEALRRLGRECIGRSLGALSKEIPIGKYKGRGCDWCAYGLFRGPVLVTMPDGSEVGAFRFAT
jgi:hypothetical protein